MKISEILNKEFKVSPTLSEFLEYLTINENLNLIVKSRYRKLLPQAVFKLIITNYNNFLKQPITLSMLVPCKDGEVLEKPHNIGLLHTYPTGNPIMDDSFKEALEYQKAQAEVLFSGWTITPKIKHLISCGEKTGNLTGQKITDNYFNFLNK